MVLRKPETVLTSLQCGLGTWKAIARIKELRVKGAHANQIWGVPRRPGENDIHPENLLLDQCGSAPC